MRRWTFFAVVGLLLAFNARADYSNTIQSFHPVGYWQLDETNAPPEDVATNLGTLGAAGNGEYLGGVAHPVAGALAGSADTAASFDGQSGEIAVPFNPALRLDAPFAVEAWVEPQQVPPAIDPAAVLGCVNAVGNGRLGWVIYQSGTNWNLRLGDTNGYTFDETGTTVVQPGTWYHLAAVYDGTNATLYVNGSVDASGPVSSFAPNNAAPFEVGNIAAFGRNDNAVVDEVAVYTNALSAAEVLAHYQNGTNTSPSVPYPQLVLAGKPLLYFRMDEPAYTPTALPVAVNRGSLGTNADGLYQPGCAPGMPGVPYTGTGTANRACGFTGVPSYIYLGTDPGLNLFDSMTLITWIKANPDVSRFQCIVGYGDTSWRMALDESGFPRFSDGQQNPDVVGTFSVNDGAWHQLAGVYDGGNLYLYVDGVSNAMVAAPSPVEGGTTYAAIGGAPDYGNRFFVGTVDDTAIFANALTANQILQIYEAANVPPRILHSPVSQTVSEGASLNLSVTAVGTPTLTFQWMRDETNLPGQTAATMTLTDVHSSEAGSYTVAVSNSFGSVVSSPAVITVLSGPPILFSQPQSLARYTGETATFSVTARGTAPLFYQWEFNEAPIDGATETNYTLTDLQVTNTGNYSCLITNAFGSTNTTAATLTVIEAPTNSYAAAVLADDPIAFWRLGETNGTVAHDYVGGHEGEYINVLQGQPGYSLLDPDKSVAFGPAVNSYVGNIPGIDFGTASTNAAFAVEAWVKCPPGQSGDVGIVAKGTGGGGEQFCLDTGANGNYRFFVRDTKGQSYSAQAYSPPNGAWQHLVGVCDEPAGYLRLYVDGEPQQDGPAVVGILSTSHAVSIGSRQSADADYDMNLNGEIDEVALYDYALSPAQVAAHFAARYPANSAPVIGVQPESSTNFVGLPVTFSVKAAGGQPLGFQWKLDGTNIPGAVFSSYTIASLDPTNAGDYSVTVRNPVDSTNSAVAHLTVWPDPTAVDVSSGLVLHLKFDGDYVDYSGRGNHGTNVGTTAFIPGEVGSGALHYSDDAGSSTFNYVSLGVRPDLQFSSNVNFSVAYWIRLPAGVIEDPVAVLGNAEGGVYFPGYEFAPGQDYYYNNNGGWLWTLYDPDYNGVYALGAADSINDGNWHQVVSTFDRTGNALTYLDSGLVDTRPIGHPGGFNSVGDLDSGAATFVGEDPTGYYTGEADVDDIGVWRRILTPFEVAGMYAAGVSHHTSFATLPITLTLTPLSTNDQVRLDWPAGLLQSADEVDGPYADMPGASSPYFVTPSEAQKFYRVRQ